MGSRSEQCRAASRIAVLLRMRGGSQSPESPSVAMTMQGPAARCGTSREHSCVMWDCRQMRSMSQTLVFSRDYRFIAVDGSNPPADAVPGHAVAAVALPLGID